MTARVLLLADVNSAHTLKLATAIADAGLRTGIFSLSSRRKEWFARRPDIQVFDADAVPDIVIQGRPARKLAYVRRIGALRRVIRAFKPDIVHAHYATSYGMLGWCSGFHPYVISAWGSDVLDRPGHRMADMLFRRVLRSADELMATSRTIQKAVQEICGRTSLLTPFGVDTVVFHRFQVHRPFAPGTVVFGTVKGLERVYRLDVVIQAFAEVKARCPERSAHLLLVGDGTQRDSLASLVERLHLANDVTFAGQVDHAEVPRYHNMIDVLVNVSAYEGFGVAVLEAMACGRPVIVSDTGGLAEIVDDGVTGFRVPPGDVLATATAMQKLLLSEPTRERMGSNGLDTVRRRYQWRDSVELMIGTYMRLISV